MKTVTSFFSGCGGLDLGFEGGFTANGTALPKLDFETVFACDINPKAKVAYDRFWAPQSKTLTLGSIVDLVKAHKKGSGSFPDADIITGGFPCQDFSVAGKRRGFESHKSHRGIAEAVPASEVRGKLYWWMVEAIRVSQPKMFVAENVRGLLSIPGALERIRSDFESAGYTLQVKLLYAPEFGVPQTRSRVIFVGVRNNICDKTVLKLIRKQKFHLLPSQTHLITNQELALSDVELKSPALLKDWLKDLPEPSDAKDPSQSAFSKCKYLGKRCQGQTEVDLNGFGPTIRSEHHGNIEYRRLSEEHGGKYVDELQAGMGERRLTVRECARIQTFPDNFAFVQEDLCASDAYKLIGNAVPPVMAHAIGTHIQTIWGDLFNE